MFQFFGENLARLAIMFALFVAMAKKEKGTQYTQDKTGDEAAHGGSSNGTSTVLGLMRRWC